MIFNFNNLKISAHNDSFKLSTWLSTCNGTKPLLYVIFAYTGSERFIKVGITSKTLKQRFKDLPYSYDLLFASYDSPTKIYNLEKRLHKKLKKLHYSYVPEIKFTGYTECYDISSIFTLSKLLDFHVDKDMFEK